MKKVIKKGEGVFEPVLEYCDKKELQLIKEKGLCPKLGGNINWNIPRITAENADEAGKILDTNLEEIISRETIPELESREVCIKCPIFDGCFKIRLLNLLEEIAHKLS